MIEQLEIYINDQKTIANYMLAFGFIILVLAILIHFSGSDALLLGLKIGLVIFGLISSIGGYGYKMTEENY